MISTPTMMEPSSSPHQQGVVLVGRQQQEQSWTESLIIRIPGICHPIHAFFPPSMLSKCQLCKDRFIDRDACRVSHKHTRLPWNNTFLCITIDSSAFVVVHDDSDDHNNNSNSSINDGVLSSSSLCRRRLARDQVYVAKPSFATFKQHGGVPDQEHEKGVEACTRQHELFTTTKKEGGSDQQEVRESQEQEEQKLVTHHSHFVFTETSEMIMTTRMNTNSKTTSHNATTTGTPKEGERVLVYDNKNSSSIDTVVNSTTTSMNTQHGDVRLGACLSCAMNNYSRKKCRHAFKHITIPHNTIHLTLYIATPEERSTLKNLCLERQETNEFLHYDCKQEIYDVESAQTNLKELERNDSFCLGLDYSDKRPPTDTFFVSLFVSASKTKIEWLDFNVHKSNAPPKKNNKSSSTSLNPPLPRRTTHHDRQDPSSSFLTNVTTSRKGSMVVEESSTKKKRIRGTRNNIANKAKKKSRINNSSSTNSNTSTSTSEDDEDATAVVMRGDSLVVVAASEPQWLFTNNDNRNNKHIHNDLRFQSTIATPVSNNISLLSASRFMQDEEHQLADVITPVNISNSSSSGSRTSSSRRTSIMMINNNNVDNKNSSCFSYRPLVHPCCPPTLSCFQPQQHDEQKEGHPLLVHQHLDQDIMLKNDFPWAAAIVSQHDQHHPAAPDHGDDVLGQQQQGPHHHTSYDRYHQQEQHEIEPIHDWERGSAGGQEEVEDEWCDLVGAPPPTEDQMINGEESDEVVTAGGPEGLSLVDEFFSYSSLMQHVEDSSFLNDYTTVWNTFFEATTTGGGNLEGLHGGNNALNLLSEEDGIFCTAADTGATSAATRTKEWERRRQSADENEYSSSQDEGPFSV